MSQNEKDKGGNMSKLMQTCYGLALLLACGVTGYACIQTRHPFALLCPLFAGVLYGVLTFRTAQFFQLSLMATFAGTTFGIGAANANHEPLNVFVFGILYYVPFFLILFVRNKRGTIVWK